MISANPKYEGGNFVEFRRVHDAASILAQIDPADADTEILADIKDEEEGVLTIFSGGNPVGVALVDEDEEAFLYVYIFPHCRRRGYGREAARLLEAQLRRANCSEIEICYRTDDPDAAALAAKMGYETQFSSAYMEYSGPAIDCGDLPVRRYRDADYPAAQALSAEAFHLMRLSTGCFPESVPDRPDEEQRINWAKTTSDRFVYLHEGEIIAYGHIAGEELSDVSVKPSQQGKGVGRKFVGYLVNQILKNGHETVSLYCVVGNGKARNLYDSMGFVERCRNCYARKKLL